jgi:hypothetical protein
VAVKLASMAASSTPALRKDEEGTCKIYIFKVPKRTSVETGRFFTVGTDSMRPDGRVLRGRHMQDVTGRAITSIQASR